MRRILRRSTFALGIAAACLALVAATGIPLYVLPPVDEIAPVDVVFVIGPVTKSDMRVATTMIDEGFTDALIVSVDDPESDRSFVTKVCDPGQAEFVICLRPDPYTTQGEARALRDLAVEHGWRSALVITSTPHVVRSRLIFERCFSGTLLVTAGDSPATLGKWAEQYVYQTGGFVKAALTPEC